MGRQQNPLSAPELRDQREVLRGRIISEIPREKRKVERFEDVFTQSWEDVLIALKRNRVTPHQFVSEVAAKINSHLS